MRIEAVPLVDLSKALRVALERLARRRAALSRATNGSQGVATEVLPDQDVARRPSILSRLLKGPRKAVAKQATPNAPPPTSLAKPSDMAAIRAKERNLKQLLASVDELRRRGATAIRIDMEIPLDQALARALTISTAESSVVAAGIDVSRLDLSPRSRTAALGVVGMPVPPSRDPRVVLLTSNRHADGLPGWRLTGRTWAAWPERLMAPRRRTAIPLLPGSYATAERFYLPVPPTLTEEVVSAGASMGRRGGFHVDLSTVDLSGPISAFLPFVAQPWYRPIPVAGIPSSSWGMSLAGLLSRSSWDTVRRSVFERYGGLCQICGQMRGGQAPECHEIWDFIHDDLVDGMRRQKLIGMACLCPSCHAAMHQGFSEAMGRGDSAAYRLADINGWTMEEAEIADECARIDAEHRSRSKWFLDLSLLGSRVLTIDSSKALLEAGLLRSKNGNGVTRIQGASFRIGAKGKAMRIASDQGRATIVEVAAA